MTILKKKRRNNRPQEGVLFLRGISESLKRRFKVFCADQGTSMTEMIEELIKAALNASGELEPKTPYPKGYQKQ